MIKDKKIGVIVAANLALSYKKQKPTADTEEIFSYAMRNLKIKKEIKIPSMAGVNFVLKYLESNPKATEREIMQKLTNETSSILNSIETQEDENWNAQEDQQLT